MKILQNWRVILLAFLVLWCAVMIHPFTKQAVEITAVENPASIVLRSGDLVYSINNEKITSMDSFKKIAENISGNDSCQVTVERETFPYSYRKITHSYISKTDDNPLAFYAKQTGFSKLKFNPQLQDSNKFIIKTSNPDDTINVLSKRFKNSRIPDYFFQKQGGDVILYTSKGGELSGLIETNGKFEARIGDKIFFTDADIERYCISGVDCMIHTYPVLNQTPETKEVIWRYGFETHISEEASKRFAPLVQNLGILTCEYDRCILNDSIKYYIDGKEVGSENIYAIDKGKNMSMLFVGGEAKTQSDALHNLYFIQAILQGRTDAKITGIETAPPLLGKNMINIFFIAIAAIIVLNSVLLLLIFKDIKISAAALLLAASEIVIILGFLAGLRMTISLITMCALLLVSTITLAYQNYSVFWIKKEGMILRKIMELNSKLNKIFWIAVIVSVVLIMINADFSAPLLFYFLLTIVITKGLFFSMVKSKLA